MSQTNWIYDKNIFKLNLKFDANERLNHFFLDKVAAWTIAEHFSTLRLNCVALKCYEILEKLCRFKQKKRTKISP